VEPEFEIDWKQFFPFVGGPPAQRAMTIDPSLSSALLGLPPDGANLVRLNLRRGCALGLPSGRDVALAMGEKPLGEAALRASPIALSDEVAEAVVHATPLWYYTLCEAQACGKGNILGPVGGRIVAEVLAGLVEGDPGSYLRQSPQWGPDDSELRAGGEPIKTMADLVTFVQQNDPA
jgi:hypothetical protein